MSKVEVEVYALSDMNTALRKLNERVKQALEQAQQAIEKEKSRLEDIRQKREQKRKQCEAEVQQCQATVQQCTADVQQCAAALQQCHSYVDKDGYSPPCTGEQQALQQAEQALREAEQALREAEQALREAEQALKEAEDQLNHFNDQSDAYLDKATRFQQSIEGMVGSARAYLEEHIRQGLNYLGAHKDEIGSIPGAGKHGALYQKARREWFRRGAGGELDREPSHLRGWMRQEVNRGGSYYRTPYRGEGRTRTTSYDTEHIVQGIDIPENFRWGLMTDNRGGLRDQLRPYIPQRRRLLFPDDD